MAKARDPARDKAKEIFDSNPGITNREIAKQLGVDEKKIATWKYRDKWCSTTKKSNVVQQKKKRSTTKGKKEKGEAIAQEVVEEIMSSDLTEKQKLFCIYYMQSFNATLAAKKAGYSKDTAFVIGHENLRKPKIKEELEKLKKMQAQELMLEVNKVLNRHAQIAFADIKDFMEYGIEQYEYQVLTEDEKVEDRIGERFNLKFKDSDEVDGTLIKKVKMGKYGLEIELEDRNKSLEFLTKHMGLDNKETEEGGKQEAINSILGSFKKRSGVDE